MRYKFEDLLQEAKKEANQEWRRECELYVPQFIEAAKSGELSAWSDDLLEHYLFNNPIASVAQAGQFYKKRNEMEKLKDNWTTIAPILRDIAINQEQPDFELYAIFSKTVSSIVGRNPESAINRMIASVQPDLLSFIVSSQRLQEVCRFLAHFTDADIKFYNSYFKDSHALQQLLLKESNESWAEVSSYVWRLYELINKKASKLQ